MSLLRPITKRWIGLVMTVIILVVGLVFYLSFGQSAADVAIGGPYNCDSNAVIYCGAGSASALVDKYNSGDGLNTAISIHHIYSYFSISAADIASLPNTAVEGYVTKSGDVYVGSRLVATNALTAGRDYIAGSNTETYGATVLYSRSPSISFVTSPLYAYVVLSNNEFSFAILASCGNPVIGTPVVPPSPKPTPKATVRPTPQPTSPAPTPTTTTTSTPTTTKPTTTTPSVAPTTSLPNTGPNDLVLVTLFSSVTSLGYLVYRSYLKRKLTDSGGPI